LAATHDSKIGNPQTGDLTVREALRSFLWSGARGGLALCGTDIQGPTAQVLALLNAQLVRNAAAHITALALRNAVLVAVTLIQRHILEARFALE
jgi:hypothetical protein